MSYEIREMSFGEILDTGFRLLRDHFRLLFLISLPVYLPLGLFRAAITAAPASALTPGLVIGGVSLVVLLLIVTYPLLTAAVTFAVGEAFLGRRASVSQALRAGLSIFLPLVGTQFLVGLIALVIVAIFAAGVFLASLVLPGALVLLLGVIGTAGMLYLMLSFLLLSQVMVFERQFGFAAVQRGHELVTGHKWRGFGLWLVIFVLVGVLSNGVAILGIALPALGAVLQSAAEALGVAFSTATLVALYFDIRCRKESFDLAHLASLVEDEASARPAPIG